MNTSRTIVPSILGTVLCILICLTPSNSQAVEQTISGLIDFRVSLTDSSDSYLKGGYGKFRYSDGTGASLAQLAINYRLDWENNFSFHLTTNAYGDNENNGIFDEKLK